MKRILLLATVGALTLLPIRTEAQGIDSIPPNDRARLSTIILGCYDSTLTEMKQEFVAGKHAGKTDDQLDADLERRSMACMTVKLEKDPSLKKYLSPPVTLPSEPLPVKSVYT